MCFTPGPRIVHDFWVRLLRILSSATGRDNYFLARCLTNIAMLLWIPVCLLCFPPLSACLAIFMYMADWRTFLRWLSNVQKRSLDVSSTLALSLGEVAQIRRNIHWHTAIGLGFVLLSFLPPALPLGLMLATCELLNAGAMYWAVHSMPPGKSLMRRALDRIRQLTPDTPLLAPNPT